MARAGGLGRRLLWGGDKDGLLLYFLDYLLFFTWYGANERLISQ